jgi:hypothetical protein
VTRNLERHEISADHIKCEISRLQWRAKNRIVDCFSRQRVIWNATVERNPMIDAVKYLAKEQIAFRGHNASDGKFVNVFTMLAKYDPAASS